MQMLNAGVQSHAVVQQIPLIDLRPYNPNFLSYSFFSLLNAVCACVRFSSCGSTCTQYQKMQ